MMDTRQDYYVYSHTCVNTGKCFYIGQGRDNRHKNGQSSRNPQWHNKAKDGFAWRILVSGLSKKRSLELERSFIEQIGIDNLTNKNLGRPKGQEPWNKGKKQLYKQPSAKQWIVDGVTYNSKREAGKALGISRDTVSYRCKHKTNFLNYEYK